MIREIYFFFRYGPKTGRRQKELGPVEFYKLMSDEAEADTGLGLELPLTKALVELHGGSLDLQSEVGTGTIATVRFPAEQIV